MNDPTADRIPLFRHDYERLKREVLRASEDVFLAAYCGSHLRFGYIVITSVRLVYVAFGTNRPGLPGLSWGKRKTKIVGDIEIETRPIPKSNLSARELATRQIFEMPLDNIIRAERLQDVDVSAQGQKKRIVRLAIRVLRESTFDVDLFPRLLIFWDPEDGVQAHDILVTGTARGKISFKQPALVNAENTSLPNCFARQSETGSTLEQGLSLRTVISDRVRDCGF